MHSSDSLFKKSNLSSKEKNGPNDKRHIPIPIRPRNGRTL